MNSQRSHIGCPDPSLCDKQGRKPCKPGSFRCGPCLSPWQENKKGHCEPMKHQHYGMRKKISMLSHSSTDASKIKQKNQDRLLNDTPTVAPPSNTPTPQPRTTGVEGKAGPIYRPGPMTDTVIVSEYDFVSSVHGNVKRPNICCKMLKEASCFCLQMCNPLFLLLFASQMGDKTLAQSAQMFHYQHQKQQMLSMGNHKPEQKVSETEGTSDEEEVGGDFTVYECPGLAPTGEMEVKNPLFDDSAIPYQGNAK
uniref:Neural proliferation, differentiation and control, 1a n=1 Tax=Amphilophus citrinellus TaxID=61819 RepID=A0A3Q0T107_AMPCI